MLGIASADVSNLTLDEPNDGVSLQLLATSSSKGPSSTKSTAATTTKSAATQTRREKESSSFPLFLFAAVILVFALLAGLAMRPR